MNAFGGFLFEVVIRGIAPRLEALGFSVCHREHRYNADSATQETRAVREVTERPRIDKTLATPIGLS
jgi:hypothetical protein